MLMLPVLRNLMLVITATLLTGCGEPVPPEKSDYVGEWKHPTISLLITQNGSVKYKREEGSVSKSIDAPLKGFKGNSFVVGFGPMNTTFVVSKPPHKVGENWVMTVDGVELTRVTAGIQSSKATISGKEEKISLTKKSMHDFAVSVQNKSMEHFHNSISNTWRKQFTVEKLNEAYGAFINQRIDLMVLDPLEPILEGDALINENGVLVIKGHYLNESLKFMFEHNYLYEDAAWKLLGFSVEVKAFSSNVPAKAPTKEEHTFLTKKSMHDFAVSVNNKSMRHFRNSVSNVLQKQLTVEELNEAYGSFINQGIDLTVLDPLEPILEDDTLINENGVLVIKGHYPTKPNKVMFEHKYIYEGEDWKLVVFGVEIN
jgi:hypothetical protein